MTLMKAILVKDGTTYVDDGTAYENWTTISKQISDIVMSLSKTGYSEGALTLCVDKFYLSIYTFL